MSKQTLEITIRIETTQQQAQKTLQLERRRYKRDPFISFEGEDGYQRMATPEEAIQCDIDAYFELLQRAIQNRYGEVVLCSGFWVDGPNSADLARKVERDFD